MKLIIIVLAIASSSFTSCGNSNSGEGDTNRKDTNQAIQTNQVVLKDSASIESVVAEYLKLKNALVADKPKEAAEASKSLKAAIEKISEDPMTGSQQKSFSDISVTLKEHAEKIGASGDIKVQRKHFQMLSNNIYDLVKAFGTTQTLYKDYCPMVKASWLSETMPIKNPYYGKEMLTCGVVQETIKN